MAVNQVLIAADGVPVLAPDETLLRSHTDVSLEVTCGDGYPGEPGSYYSQGGSIYLTTCRCIYLPPIQYRTPRFWAFTIPLGLCESTGKSGITLSNSWFSAPSIRGVVSPVPYGGLPRAGTFRIFMERVNIQSFFTQLKQGIEKTHRDIAQAGPEYLAYLDATTPPPLIATGPPVPVPSADAPPLAAHPDLIMIPSFDFHGDLQQQASPDPISGSPPPPTYYDSIKTSPPIEMDTLRANLGTQTSATTSTATSTSSSRATTPDSITSSHVDDMDEKSPASSNDTLRRRHPRGTDNATSQLRPPLLDVT